MSGGKIYVHLWLPALLFLPLVVHAWAGLATGVTGIMTLRAPKHREYHPRWGTRYLWAYTLVFLTATILSVDLDMIQGSVEPQQQKLLDHRVS